MQENVSFKSHGGVVRGKLYLTEGFIAAKTQDEAEMLALEGGSHLRTYDTPDFVAQRADALSVFFKKNLGNQH